MSPELTKKILDAVEQGFDDQVAATRELVRIPSQMHEEHLAQDHMVELFRMRDLPVDRWRLDEGELENHPGFSPVDGSYENTWNVVGIHRPEQERGRSLILNGHIDVVPVGPRSQWTHDPYDPVVEGDWLYGRGSGDMKAGLLANLFALDALRRIGRQPSATVYLQSVVEEECTGNGALACLVRGYRADAAIIPEPMDEKLMLASTGVLWFRIRIMGSPAHLALSRGANAIDNMYGIIQALKDLEEEWNARKEDHPLYRDKEHPINLNVGRIRGGDWPSSVAAWCEIDCRVNCYPGLPPEAAAGEIEERIRAHCGAHPWLSNNPPVVEYPGFRTTGFVLKEGTEAVSLLESCHRTVADADLQRDAFMGHLDANLLQVYGDIPTLVYGPVSESIHSFDERVNLPSLRRVTQAIALFVAEWCGLEELAA